MARIQPEFERRGVKILGLSVDPTEKHSDWIKDIEENQGRTVNYPIHRRHRLRRRQNLRNAPRRRHRRPRVKNTADNQTVRTYSWSAPTRKSN